MAKSDVILKIDAKSVNLHKLFAYEKELEEHGITFDSGILFDGKGIPKTREWQLDWAWKAPKGVTRQSVIKDLRKQFPNAKIRMARE